jgi:hypothetical protein
MPGPFLDDETPPDSGSANLRLALEAYEPWLERVRDPDLLIPFYRQLFRGRVCRQLEGFPTIERSDHDTRRREFVNTAFNDPRADQLSIYTNGTFSRCLRVSWDLPSLFDLNHASYLRFGAVLPDLFENAVTAEPTVFVISDSPRDQRASVVMPALNGTILRRLVAGRGEASDAALVRYLRNSRIALLHGKPSVLLTVMDLDRSLEGGGRIEPASVVCSGENLYPDDRGRIEAWFGCRLLDAYVASETGMLALECPEGTGLHVFADHLRVEVVAEDGSSSETGRGELLVTNAMNWRHAFVRYRIGDRGTLVDAECRCGHVGIDISELSGRERATYGPISARQIAFAIAEAGAGVKQYQVAPGTGQQLIISWIPDGSTNEDSAAAKISASLRGRLAGTAFELRRVDVINTPGGKLRRFL